MGMLASRVRSVLLIAAIVGTTWAGSAQALGSASGLELLLTDPRARTLVGYGLLLGDSLTLDLSTRLATLHAVIAHPDGRVGQWHAELQEHRLWLYDPDEGWLDLAAVLAADGVALRLRYDDGTQVQVEPLPGSFPPGIGPGPPQPARGEPAPGGPSPGVTAPRPVSDDDDAPDDDGDDADDDDGDDADDGDGDDGDDADGDDGDDEEDDDDGDDDGVDDGRADDDDADDDDDD